MGIELGNLAVLRTFRVLRALKTVAIVPGKYNTIYIFLNLIFYFYANVLRTLYLDTVLSKLYHYARLNVILYRGFQIFLKNAMTLFPLIIFHFL